MVRHRHVLAIVCLVCLLTLWLCRLPKFSFYNPLSCVADQPQTKTEIDLSRPDAPFISWPLARVCKETVWTPGIVFICDNNSGGIGNIRNYILTCLRYAIEAGATGLVLPKIRTRAPDDLAKIMQPHQGFDYFFDESHFRQSLESACPRITVYDSVDAIPNVARPAQAEQIKPRDFGRRGGCDNRELNKHSDRFGVQLQAHVQDKVAEFHTPPPSLTHPHLFRLVWGVQWDWQVYRDGSEFVATYGGLLKFRKDILELGAKVAAYMRQYAVAQRQKSGSNTFVGMHLRSENDALSNWPKFEDQSSAYLERASALGLRAAYLATGNQTEAGSFAKLASSQYAIQVTTKEDLLHDYPKDLESMKALTWDQQGLIDFIVLLESDHFFGVNPSSFSMNVALKRHVRMEGLHTRPWKIGGDGDGRSWIMGNFERYWDDWLFMYDSLWP